MRRYDERAEEGWSLAAEATRLRARIAELEAELAKEHLSEELAWGVIANASGGDWNKQSPEWREAAERWRDAWLGR